MLVSETKIPGCLIIEPKVFGDERGFFFEFWNKKNFDGQGLKLDPVQDNISFSSQGVLRGLHLQFPHPQGKLVSVLEGEVFDVAVDLRKGSPTFKKWIGTNLSSKKQMYIPPGLAHGFVVLSKTALFFYKCTDLYYPEHEKTIIWNDPDLNIEWPIKEPKVSAKDLRGIRFSDLAPNHLVQF